jgi:hypothetical protein
MNKVLEFPSKIFVQWGAIAQEIVPYLAQRGAKREEIRAVIERLRSKWEQHESAPPCHGSAAEFSDAPGTAEASASLEEGSMYVARHWRTQSARALIEAAMADYQRNARR